MYGVSRGCAFPGPRPIQRLPCTPASPRASHTGSPRCPGRARGFRRRGPSRPLTRFQLLGDARRKVWRHPTPRPSRGGGEAAAAAGRPVRPARGLAARALLGDRRPASPGPRRTTLTFGRAASATSAWPGVVPSDSSPPEGTGPARAPPRSPPTPAGAEVAAVAEAWRPPGPHRAPGPPQPRGSRRSAAEPGRGRKAVRGTTEVLQADPPRSLQRRWPPRRRRRWATAPLDPTPGYAPGPRRPPGHER